MWPIIHRVWHSCSRTTRSRTTQGIGWQFGTACYCTAQSLCRQQLIRTAFEQRGRQPIFDQNKRLIQKSEVLILSFISEFRLRASIPSLRSAQYKAVSVSFIYLISCTCRIYPPTATMRPPRLKTLTIECGSEFVLPYLLVLVHVV